MYDAAEGVAGVATDEMFGLALAAKNSLRIIQQDQLHVTVPKLTDVWHD